MTGVQTCALPISVIGTAVYTSTFTPSTTPLQPIANTSLLTCQSPRFVDNSANNYSITPRGTASVQRFSPYSGTTLPTPYYGAYFDGSGDYLTVPASSSFAFGTGDFTIEFWMNTSDTTAGLITPATQGAGYWALMIYSSSLYWQSAYNVTNLKNVSLSGYLNNTWVHVAIVKYSGNINFYFNGTVQGSATADGSNYNGSATLTIGYDSLGNGYYTGYISNLRIVKEIGRAHV